MTALVVFYIADRWNGQRNAVVIGALLMSGGHLAMASEQTSVLPLLLLVVGSGLLMGNISAQVGVLYPRNEEALRTRGFAVFSIARTSLSDRRRAPNNKFIEHVGFYNPLATAKEEKLRVNNERVQYWIGKGAKPTERVAALLKGAAAAM